MTNTLTRAFRVRGLRGRLTLGNEDSGGDWVEPGLDLTFELHGPHRYSARVPILADGSFHVADLRPGTYCFRVSSPYLQAYEGTIVIDPRTVHEDTIEIHIAMGA